MAPKAHRTGPGSLKFGAVGTEKEFAAQATNVLLTPSVDEEDPIPVLSGEEIPGDATVTWELSGTLLQSFDKAGLIYWANENALAILPFDFVPSTADSEYGWRGQAKIIPLATGGDVKTRNTSDFTFKVVGEPAPYDIPVVP